MHLIDWFLSLLFVAFKVLLLRIKVLFKKVLRFQSGLINCIGFHTFFVDSEDHGVVDKLNSVEYCVWQS